MLTFTEKAKRLDRARRAMKRVYGDVAPSPVTHPVRHAVRTVLAEEATADEVEAALQRIHDAFIDWNDLRVSRPREIRDVLGEAFPRASTKARVIPRLLDQVFKRHNSMVWDFLEGMGKIETREFFERLEEVRPFLAATMARDCVGAHAFPVDHDISRALGRLGLVDPAADSETDMQAFMERAAKSNQAYELHGLLKRLAEAVCVVETPKCSKCPLKKMCPTAEALAAERRTRKTKAPKKAAPARKKAAAKKAAPARKKAAAKTGSSARKKAGAKTGSSARKKAGAKTASSARKKKAATRAKSAKGKAPARAKKTKKATKKKTATRKTRKPATGRKKA